MGELGFMGMMVPEEYSGAGMDTLTYVIALEEIAAVEAAASTIMSVNNSSILSDPLYYKPSLSKASSSYFLVSCVFCYVFSHAI